MKAKRLANQEAGGRVSSDVDMGTIVYEKKIITSRYHRMLGVDLELSPHQRRA